MYKIPEKTGLIGKKIISLPACESTNTVLGLQAERLEEGTILITENQTKGRGQAGNAWQADAGLNLTFSVLLKPIFLEPGRQFYLNMAVGLAVAEAAALVSGLTTTVKWPNDIMVANKKICGILIENQIQGTTLGQAVVGIGLNVNQQRFDWPQASSLCLESNQYFNRAEVLEKVLEKLDARYSELQSGNTASLSGDYHDNLYWRGSTHEFEATGENFSGIIQGVDEIGRLKIDTKKGVRHFNFKEVRFIQ